MWVYPCFEGDNMALAWSQHDLYFGENLTREEWLGQHADSTAGYFLQALVEQVARRAGAVPWFDRHWVQLYRIGNYSHKLVQTPHEHIAAYYRWRRRNDPLPLGDEAANRTQYLRDWREYVAREIPALMRVDDIAVLFGRVLLYRNFDASDRAADRLDERLVEHYGIECVAQTWRAEVPALMAIAESKSLAYPVVEEQMGEIDPATPNQR